MTRPTYVFLVLAAVACTRSSATNQLASSSDGERWVTELLAAEADHSRRASQDLVGGLGGMFAADVVMPAGREHSRGREAAVAALRANPANANARATWTPARVGVSGDGRYGFSYGYMRIGRADGSTAPAKYAAFWRRDVEGWRVIAYKRAPRPDGPETPAPWGHLVPTRLTASPDRVAAYREEVWQAEVAFSDEAQRGIRAAFTKFAAPDGAHMGIPTDSSFRFGPAAIGAAFPPNPDTTSVTTWGPTEAVAAASGDLGLTVGYIVTVRRPLAGAKADTTRFPYFSIWRRAAPGQPWRFVFD